MIARITKLLIALWNKLWTRRVAEPKPGQGGVVPPFRTDTVIPERAAKIPEQAAKEPEPPMFPQFPSNEDILKQERKRALGSEIEEVLAHRNCEHEDVAVIFLDLSSSVRYIAEEMHEGWRALRASLIDQEIRVILIGFNSRIFLLADGMSAELPTFSVGFFSGREDKNTLQPETRLHYAFYIGGILGERIRKPRSLSFLWLTDGVASHDDRETAEVLAFYGIKALAMQGLPIELRGILNPMLEHGDALAKLLRDFNIIKNDYRPGAKGNTGEVSEELPQSASRSFIGGATFIIESRSRRRPDDTELPDTQS